MPDLTDDRSKMVHHIREFERWQSTVEAYETAARDRAKAEDRPAAVRQDVTWLAKKLLEGNPGYETACASRNGHQQAALMYGLAAQVRQQVTT